MSNCNDITLAGLEKINACENNMSGVKTIYLCPLDDIAAINAKRPTNMQSLDDFVTIGSDSLSDLAIECKPGKGFVRIHTADDMGEMKYASQGEIEGCRSQKGTLEIFHPGFKRRAIALQAYLNNKPAIVIAKLNNGEYHLLGDEERGAKLASGAEMTSGKASTDNNGITPTFEYNIPAPQIFWDGFDPKDPVNGIPIIGNDIVATPVISQEEGSNSVTISCSTTGATIYYTTDGSTPSSTNGTAYSSAITLSESKTIKAIAIKNGMANSAVASKLCTYNED